MLKMPEIYLYCDNLAKSEPKLTKLALLQLCMSMNRLNEKRWGLGGQMLIGIGSMIHEHIYWRRHIRDAVTVILVYLLKQIEHQNVYTPSDPDLQVTPTSLEWSQLCTPNPRWLHSSRLDSLPWQRTLSIKIGPEPLMSHHKSVVEYSKLAPSYPSILHTTSAFVCSHRSSQTVPHWPL